MPVLLLHISNRSENKEKKERKLVEAAKLDVVMSMYFCLDWFGMILIHKYE